ncbi:SAM-dependent methyltransferase [Solwaraspora sp. WMMD791]|uniref:SAM-dependent methyltransferase n=1 Tax=Solwaraspora sp. WMMD791 TaxID=3016086 RepID=UPI00249B8CEF|nr:SAM-dependent methyltransferase [Solwaraspora sp. WMMD791]WFE27396.1 SAM-dependent methyltransferase [Solwaraspora sp. WMMD791]
MTDQLDDVPAGVDISRPSAARVYDYFLGGAHNFEVDRQLAEQIMAMTPHLAETMRAGRAFLRRAVRMLLADGVDQFLDIGSGIPTVGNVHEVTHAVDPTATVVYVDIDPVAVAHSRTILADVATAAVIQADLREPDTICDRAVATGLIDFGRPVAVLLAGVAHFIPDADDPQEILRRLRAHLAPGSYLVISHATYEDQPAEVLAAQRLSARTDTEITLRSRADVAAMFGDFTVVEPGIVHLPLWRPDSPTDVDDHPERFGAFGGVARRDAALS